MAQTPTQVSKSPHPLEAFLFGNLGSWCLDVRITQAPVRMTADTVQQNPFSQAAQTADAFHGQKLKLGG